MTDLPRTDLSQRGGHQWLPEQRPPGTVQVRGGRHPATRQFWLGFAVAAFVIWLLSGATGPWILWVAVPLAFIMLRRWSLGAERRIREHQDRHPGHPDQP